MDQLTISRAMQRVTRAIAPLSTVARRAKAESGPPYSSRRTASPSRPDWRVASARAAVHSPLGAEYLKPACPASPRKRNASLLALWAAIARSRGDREPALTQGNSASFFGWAGGAGGAAGLVVVAEVAVGRAGRRTGAFSDAGASTLPFGAAFATGFVAVLSPGFEAVLGAGLGAGFFGSGLDAETVRRGGATLGCESLRTRSRSSARESVSARLRVRVARVGGTALEADIVLVLR